MAKPGLTYPQDWTISWNIRKLSIDMYVKFTVHAKCCIGTAVHAYI